MDSRTPSNHVHLNSLSEFHDLESTRINDRFSSRLNSKEELDCSDATLKLINVMLMEEEDEIESKPYMLHDYLALQATERSFYEALNNNNPEQTEYKREKKNRDDLTEEEQRSKKRFARNVGDESECESLAMYDSVLLYSDTNHLKEACTQHSEEEEGRDKKKDITITKQMVDLRGLLMTCSQAMANLDTTNVVRLLRKIRAHTSPQGDSLERVCHYFANAIEARLAGTGSALYAALKHRTRSAAQILKAQKMYITACPFYKMSVLLANKAIGKLAIGATTLHIIDLGILHGFQWPSLIQNLPEIHGGPPKLRITGIEFPQKGGRIEETGRRLAKYCERFGVPFEYNAIADQQWDNVKVEDLKIEKDEVVVVNSLNRLHHLLDETVIANSSPRAAVLNLIKNINPVMFIHGVTNGQYSTPFFTRRFAEAFFHFTNMFDMFEATVPRDEESRLLFEEQLLGTEAMNVIACERSERIERPESYKQWQIRMRKAGFRQLGLDQEMVKCVRSKVKTEYHKEFSVDEDGKWMLQGWKGRVIDVISCWQSVC